MRRECITTVSHSGCAVAGRNFTAGASWNENAQGLEHGLAHGASDLGHLKSDFLLSSSLNCGGIRASQKNSIGCVAVSEKKIQQRSEGGAYFQQPISFPESAQTLAGMAHSAAGKSGWNLAASKFAGNPPSAARTFGQPRSLLELCELRTPS